MYVTSGPSAQPQASAHINTRVLTRAVGSPACRDPLHPLQGSAPTVLPIVARSLEEQAVLPSPSAQGRYREPGLCFEPLNPHGTWTKETQLSAPLHSCQR